MGDPLPSPGLRESRCRHVDVLHCHPAARLVLRLLLRGRSALHRSGSAIAPSQHRSGLHHVRHLWHRNADRIAAVRRDSRLFLDDVGDWRGAELAVVLAEFGGDVCRDHAAGAVLLPLECPCRDAAQSGRRMKAVVKYAPGPGNIEVRDVKEPAFGPGLVKVQVAFCGVCGTDLHVLHDTFRNYPPVILGHECAGTVSEVGAGVTGISVGDAVTVLGATAVTCGRCAYCRSGYFIFCPARRGMGHGVDGAFARYLVVRPDQLYRLPDGMSLQAGALSEPFAAVVQAVTEMTQVRLGETAVVSGPGPIGLLCLKLLVAEGIQTIVAGTPGDADRLPAAPRFWGAPLLKNGESGVGGGGGEKHRGGGAGVALAMSCAPPSG